MRDTAFTSWEDAVQWLIDQPDQRKLVRACYYDPPLERAARRYWRSDEWKAVRQFLPEKAGCALDLGAGNGIASSALAREGWKVIALEPDKSDLVGAGAIRRLAQQEQLPLTVMLEFGERISLPDSSVQLVFARQALHHAQNLDRLCKEVARILEPGGLFVAIRDHVLSRRKDLDQFLSMHPLHRFYGGENAYLLRQYKTALARSGLKIDVVLGSFESIINYAPMTESQLKEELLNRINCYPGGTVIARLLRNRRVFARFLRILSKLDRRPGRLFSFICHKPG